MLATENHQSIPGHFLTVADISAMGRFSKAHLHALVKGKKFPAPRVKQARFTRWHSSDVAAWFADPKKWQSEHAGEV